MNGRYEIVSCYFGLFEEKRVIAVTDNLPDAKFICTAMNKALDDRPFIFQIRKVAKEYDDILDEDTDLLEFATEE